VIAETTAEIAETTARDVTEETVATTVRVAATELPEQTELPETEVLNNVNA
jgi:hypothetical protein